MSLASTRRLRAEPEHFETVNAAKDRSRLTPETYIERVFDDGEASVANGTLQG